MNPTHDVVKTYEQTIHCPSLWTVEQWIMLVALLISGTPLSSTFADEREQFHVGVQPDGRIVVPTNQVLDPAGTQVTFPGRPVDLALADDGKLLVIKNTKDLVLIDSVTGRLRQTVSIPRQRTKPPGFSVVGLLISDDLIYASDAENHVRVFRRQNNGEYLWVENRELTPPAVGGAVHPAGIARLSSGELLVTSTRGNSVQLINETTGKVEQVVPVGVAPYTICVRSLSVVMSATGEAIRLAKATLKPCRRRLRSVSIREPAWPTTAASQS
jgi:YVTN family beta-propeller protein